MSQVSSVHALPSSQVSGVPAMQAPDSPGSSPLPRLLSAHEAASGWPLQALSATRCTSSMYMVWLAFQAVVTCKHRSGPTSPYHSDLMTSVRPGWPSMEMVAVSAATSTSMRTGYQRSGWKVKNVSVANVVPFARTHHQTSDVRQNAGPAPTPKKAQLAKLSNRTLNSAVKWLVEPALAHNIAPETSCCSATSV